ncbi:MAG: hypothetical protein A2Y07_11800 [Planctomycetes bacterium GWF2_50_10]|nr:MAG: hypothetical protein A2Y07_11800 [Planctomycetes bacterium GWF2_50_10]
MAQHEVEITILKSGEVKVHVKGAKGKACMEYANWLAKVVGEIKDQKLTSEYYEAQATTAVKLQQKLANG